MQLPLKLYVEAANEMFTFSSIIQPLESFVWFGVPGRVGLLANKKDSFAQYFNPAANELIFSEFSNVCMWTKVEITESCCCPMGEKGLGTA